MDGRPSGLNDEGLDNSPVPPQVDLNVPSISRLYDYLLGGKEHFAVDRKACRALFEAVPETAQIARDNRNVLGRSVRYLVGEAGIRQIIDLGSGLPTEGNFHEMSNVIYPDVRVVYVDKDPIVLAHGRALLADDNTTTVITADVLEPDSIFDDPSLRELIDFDQPFAVVAAGIMHHFSDAEDPFAVAAAIRARLGSGCYAMFSNFLDDDEPRAKELQRAFLEGGLGHGRFRPWSELKQYFEGLEMVEPGLVYANDWRPDATTPTDSPTHTLYSSGIGRKP